MEVLSVRNLAFKYINELGNVLDDVTFQVKKGEIVLVAGGSGSGKTTLLKMIKSDIMPAGELSGKIKCEYTSDEMGYIFQDPEAQIVCSTVWEELVFGAENIGMPVEQMRLALAETSSYLGIEDMLYKETSKLSGGEKQIVNLAAVLMMNPRMLLLDEPLSQLDPVSSYNFIKLIQKINNETGITIIIVEHNLDKVLEIANSIVYLNKGNSQYYPDKNEFIRALVRENDDFKESLPQTIKMLEQYDFQINKIENYPLSFSDFMEMIQYRKPVYENRKISADAKEIIRIKKGCFRYEKEGKDVLNEIELSIREGQIYGLIGGNGCGKSTLFSVMDGHRRLYKGKCRVDGKIVLLPQNPIYCFVEECIKKDYLQFADEDTIKSLFIKYDFLKDMPKLIDSNPDDLSGGQLQMAAIGKLLLCDFDILLMDEPTKALDGELKKKLENVIFELKNKGKTVIVISHDLEFIENIADECMHMFDGKIIGSDNVQKIFSHNRFYTTLKGKMTNVTS